jgi:Sec-independent protein translocase protein TatA
MPFSLALRKRRCLNFGANKLPQMSAGLAKGIRNFKKGIDEKEETEAIPKKIEEKQIRLPRKSFFKSHRFHFSRIWVF